MKVNAYSIKHSYCLSFHIIPYKCRNSSINRIRKYNHELWSIYTFSLSRTECNISKVHSWASHHFLRVFFFFHYRYYLWKLKVPYLINIFTNVLTFASPHEKQNYSSDKTNFNIQRIFKVSNLHVTFLLVSRIDVIKLIRWKAIFSLFTHFIELI